MSNGSYSCPSKRTGVNHNCAGYKGRTIQRQISQKVYERLEALIFLLSIIISTLLPHAVIFLDRWLLLRDVLNLRISVNTYIFVVRMIPPAGLVDPFLLMVQMVS